MENENMNIEVILEYLKKDPNLLVDIHNIMKYRDLRTEQVYYARLAYEYDHVDIMKQCKEVRNSGNMDRMRWRTRSENLDKDRRQTHNKALISFNSILRTGENCNLPTLYNGKKLTNEEIAGHLKAERREEITDSMFEMLWTIEDSVIESENSREVQDIRKIKQDMRTFNRTYNVEKSMLKDESDEKDGGIEFGFSAIDLYNSQELKFDFSELFTDS